MDQQLPAGEWFDDDDGMSSQQGNSTKFRREWDRVCRKQLTTGQDARWQYRWTRQDGEV
jgi:hypothetical protein